MKHDYETRLENELQLEIVPISPEPTTHEKIMAAYARINLQLDLLIERRKKSA